MEDVRRGDELEKLISELSWVKRLATALVRNESDAEDLVQETWLLATKHAPTDGRPLKPWLSRVVLNLVRMRSRASKRRVAREVAVEPSAEQSLKPDELVGRVQAQRIVADEVLRLAEPYRNTVLLHYFEDLSSAEIARRSGVPEGTVRRRLKFALDELRSRLHAEERKTGLAVIAVLAPFAIKQSAASAGGAALGALLVKKAIAVVVVVVGMIFVGAQLYKHHAPSSAQAVTKSEPVSGPARPPADPGRATAHVVVTVSDSAGPVANAIVRCAPADGEIVTATTASDGNATIDLAAGPWSIAASAEGHAPAATALAVGAARDQRVRLVLTLGGQTLTGMVTDITGGVIAGARIDGAPLDLNLKAGSAIAVAFSDSEGRYKLTIGVGQTVVAASHPAYASQTRYVVLGAPGATANFALVPGGSIDGLVRDAQTNQPVAGAAVQATSDSPANEIDTGARIVMSDAAGTFHLAGLRPGQYELSARAGARRSRVTVGLGLGIAEQQTNVVVLVAGTATIRGKVVDAAGAAAPHVTVTSFGEGGKDNAIADETGVFVLEGLPPSRFSLTAESDGYVSDGRAIVELKKTDIDGVVVHVRHGLEVKGHVEPREVCDVEIANAEQGNALGRRYSTTTTLDGAFHFAPFGSGKATLVARCPNGDQGTLSVAVAAGGGDSIVALTPGGSIEGTIVDTSGKPVGGVMVSAEPSGHTRRIDSGNVVSGFRAVTSTAGTFEIGLLPAADYRLSVLDTGRPMKATKPVKLALSAAQHATGVTVIVERPNGTISGTVTDQNGAPIADAWVALDQSFKDQLDSLSACDDPADCFISGSVSTGSHQPPPAMTDGRGHFELTSLPHGRYQVVAEAQGGRLRGGAADVTTDAQISIKLGSLGSLRGNVHGPHGPTDLFSVDLTGPSGNRHSFTDGAFVFPRLDPGDYTIDVESPEGTGTAKVRVASDESSVDIVLVANGTVTGRVVDKAGKPVTGMGVALIPDQPPGQLSVSLHEDPPTNGPDGHFAVQGAPGIRTLVVLGRKVTAKRGVSVVAGSPVDVGDVVIDE